VLLNLLGLDDIDPADQYRRSQWGELQRRFEAVFITCTRDEWCDLLEGTDACFAPVLSMSESTQHAHNKARGTFVTIDGIKQAAPAPRFSRTHSEISSAAGPAEPDLHRVLKQWGASKKVLNQL
jgi:alpha-methylacyl-CoA racemase